GSGRRRGGISPPQEEGRAGMPFGSASEPPKSEVGSPRSEFSVPTPGGADLTSDLRPLTSLYSSLRLSFHDRKFAHLLADAWRIDVVEIDPVGDLLLVLRHQIPPGRTVASGTVMLDAADELAANGEDLDRASFG